MGVYGSDPGMLRDMVLSIVLLRTRDLEEVVRSPGRNCASIDFLARLPQADEMQRHATLVAVGVRNGAQPHYRLGAINRSKLMTWRGVAP
jgi:hypothetical protein